MKPQADLAGIILAAGESQRMGQSKPFLSWQGKCFVEIIAERLTKAGIDELFIVFNFKDKDRVNPLNLCGAHLIFNDKIELGQVYSLQLALKEVQANYSTVMMCLVDHPTVAPETYQLLIERSREEPDQVIIPVYGDRRGHPVILPGWILSAILTAGTEHGVDYIIKQYPERISQLAVADEGVVININTKEKYQQYILEAE